MAVFPSAKEEIKRSADIVELIGQFVQLRKAGQNYMGLCPFHAEKDPSFTVSPARQTFHCFGCKKGGDVFTFWMEYHNSTFPEALRDLAERFQVNISEGLSEPRERRKAALREAIFRVNEVAAAHFQRVLKHKKGESGRDYLKRRLVPEEVISEFRLGYAPEEWDSLVQVLKRDGLDLEVAVQAGMVIRRESGGYYDRFRGRVIFPILDLRQKVVGFGGRILDDSLPKYLNTPESPVFHKGHYLYGLNISHKGIRQKGRAVIVEGYMDCLALRRHGLEEVAASLGTALTENQVRKLKGYAEEAVVVFDADEAGKSAASRSLSVFSNEGLSAKAVMLPDGYDPDSYVNENGLGGFLELLDQAVPMFDFHLDQKLRGTSSDEGKIRVLAEVIPILSEIRNYALRSLYVKRLSDRIGVKENMVFSELERFTKAAQGSPPLKGLAERSRVREADKRLSDRHLLNLLVHHPHTVPRLMECQCQACVSDPVVKEIVDIIFKRHGEGPVTAENLLESVQSQELRQQITEVLHQPIQYSDVEQAVTEFEHLAHQRKVTAAIQEARKTGDIARLVQLTKLKAQRATIS